MLPPARTAAARLAAALVAVVLLATGCTMGSTQAHTEIAPMAGAASLDGGTYVAMGDSYTAAPLYPLKELPRGCLRSNDNYPTIVAKSLNLHMTDVSCSGASTTSMFGNQHFAVTDHSRPPQLDALNEDTDLVTLGIGANDFAFFTHMMFDCLNLAKEDPTGAPCRRSNSVSGTDELAHKLGAIKRRVTKVVRSIRQRAPYARILMVGYPQLLPPSGDCRTKLPLAVGDYPYTKHLNNRLVKVVHKGAVKGGAEYVDVESASEGHDICSKQPWIAGIRGDGGRAMGLHPYPAEQRAVASLVLNLLASPPAAGTATPAARVTPAPATTAPPVTPPATAPTTTASGAAASSQP